MKAPRCLCQNEMKKEVSNEKKKRLNKHVKNPKACFFSKSSKSAVENIQLSERQMVPTKLTADREVLWNRHITVIVI